jgi:ATP-binding cassette subfamily C (CFTR/MRP) protein 1
MAHPGQEKKEHGTADLAVAADTANHHELLDVDNGDGGGDGDEEKDYIQATSHGDSSNHSGSESGDNEKEQNPGLEHVKSYAISTSDMTRTDSHVDQPIKKKPWYKYYNPLRWGKIPPVPETRKVSREYNAPFLSLVYFQWMAPLMSVGFQSPFIQPLMLIRTSRLATNDRSNRMTSGLSIQIERPSL